MFNKNEAGRVQVVGLSPDQLVRYVGYGYKNNGVAVVGLYIAQLASLVSIVPVVDGVFQQSLPFDFIQPRSVENIFEILSAAQGMYPGNGRWC